MFERNELFPEGVIEAEDTLVVTLRWRGLPRGSTSFVEQRLIGTFTFRDVEDRIHGLVPGTRPGAGGDRLPNSARRRA